MISGHLFFLTLLGFSSGQSQSNLQVAFNGISRYLTSVDAPCGTISSKMSLGPLGKNMQTIVQT